MVKVDFSNTPIYDFNVYDSNNNFLYRGLMNSKAWNKTIETNEIWEYINENGRVIGKDFYPLFLDLNKIELIDHRLNIYLITKNNDEMNNDFDSKSTLEKLEKIILKRKLEKTENSYTTNLFEKGLDKILKKLGEETIELIIASNDSDEEIIYETADLIYHIMVLLSYKNIPFDNILKELSNRMEK